MEKLLQVEIVTTRDFNGCRLGTFFFFANSLFF